jgi:hypothetical protein
LRGRVGNREETLQAKRRFFPTNFSPLAFPGARTGGSRGFADVPGASGALGIVRNPNPASLRAIAWRPGISQKRLRKGGVAALPKSRSASRRAASDADSLRPCRKNIGDRIAR